MCDLAVKVPPRFLKVLLAVTFVVGTSNVLNDIAQVIRKFLGFNKIDCLDTTLRVVRGMVDHINIRVTELFLILERFAQVPHYLHALLLSPPDRKHFGYVRIATACSCDDLPHTHARKSYCILAYQLGLAMSASISLRSWLRQVGRFLLR